MKKAAVLVFLCALAFQSQAGCWLDGKEYPVGIVKDGYQCDESGQWVKL